MNIALKDKIREELLGLGLKGWQMHYSLGFSRCRIVFKNEKDVKLYKVVGSYWVGNNGPLDMSFEAR